MSDYLLTIAATLDREPLCTCVSTDRGTDTLGCDLHDDEPTDRQRPHLAAGEE